MPRMSTLMLVMLMVIGLTRVAVNSNDEVGQVGDDASDPPEKSCWS